MTIFLAIVCFGILTAFFVSGNSNPVEDENQLPPLRLDGFPSTYPERWMFDIPEDAPKRIPRLDLPDDADFSDLLDDNTYQWVYRGEADFDLGFECDLFGSWGEGYNRKKVEIPPINSEFDPTTD